MRNVLFMAMTEFRKVRDLLFKNIYIVKIYHQFSKEATITVIKHINRRIAFLPILVVAILPVLSLVEHFRLWWCGSFNTVIIFILLYKLYSLLILKTVLPLNLSSFPPKPLASTLFLQLLCTSSFNFYFRFVYSKCAPYKSLITSSVLDFILHNFMPCIPIYIRKDWPSICGYL